MLADRFTQIFRDEHRQVRDALLDLGEAFQARDRARMLALLNKIAALTGPHFRYEEEALYPALTGIFGDEYVEHLFSDHDRAIGAAQALVALAHQRTMSDADVARAARLVRGVLPHVSDCDGLSIMVERLPEATVNGILEARDRSLKANLDLIQWADNVRSRPSVAPG